MENNSGSCLCGKVKYKLHGNFEGFFLCHCKFCQKDTGSAHAANLFSSNAKLEWISGEESVKTFNLAPTRHTKAFCLECGSALPNLQRGGGVVVVPAGSLDTEVTIKPNAHIFMASKANWETDLDSVPKLDGFPGS